MRFNRLIVAVILAVTPVAAPAEFPVMFDGLAGQLAMTDLMMEPLRRESARRDKENAVGPRRKAASSVSPAASRPATVRTTYTADPSVGQRVRRQFASFVAKQAKLADVAKVERELQAADLLAKWNTVWGRDGLRQGDLVDAQTSYFITNWIIANGSGDTSAAQTRGVRAQFRPILSTNRALASLNNAQRQEMSEILMLNGVTQVMAYVDARNAGNKAMLAKLAQAAVLRFRNEAGVDLRTLSLTDKGFAAR